MIIYYCFGGVAQLGERLNGIQEVNGSIPSVSTIFIIKGYIIRCALLLLPMTVETDGIEGERAKD